MTFQLYKASEVQNANASDGTISEGGYTYKYDTTNPIKGSYINAALETTDYKSAVKNSAENSKHSKNYGKYTSVQKHAEPIYWITDSALDADKTILFKQLIHREITQRQLRSIEPIMCWRSVGQRQQRKPIFLCTGKG